MLNILPETVSTPHLLVFWLIKIITRQPTEFRIVKLYPRGCFDWNYIIYVLKYFVSVHFILILIS